MSAKTQRTWTVCIIPNHLTVTLATRNLSSEKTGIVILLKCI